MKLAKFLTLSILALFILVSISPAVAVAGNWREKDDSFNIIFKNNDTESSINIVSSKDGHDVVVTTEGENLEITTEAIASLAGAVGDIAHLGTVFLVSMLWFGLIAGLIAMVLLVFWLSMLIHSITNPIPNKIVWIVVNIVFGLLGAIVYYFAVKQKIKNNLI